MQYQTLVSRDLFYIEKVDLKIIQLNFISKIIYVSETKMLLQCFITARMSDELSGTKEALIISLDAHIQLNIVKRIIG